MYQYMARSCTTTRVRTIGFTQGSDWTDNISKSLIRNTVVLEQPHNTVPTVQTHIDEAIDSDNRPVDHDQEKTKEHCQTLLGIHDVVKRDEGFCVS